jgi:hypothetical protein
VSFHKFSLSSLPLGRIIHGDPGHNTKLLQCEQMRYQWDGPPL